MRFFTAQICLIASATLSSAQLLDLPTCAQDCAQDLPPKCGIDVKCICSSSEWITGISCCVKKTCSPEDQQKTINIAADLCKAAGVTVPQAASCAASESPASGSSTQPPAAVQSSTSSSSLSTTTSIRSSSSSTSASISGATTTIGTSISQTATSPSTFGAATPTIATTHTAAALFARPSAVLAGAVVAALALL